MSHENLLMYTDLLAALRKTAETHQLLEILAAPVAYAPEFSDDKSFFFSDNIKRYCLPASNTFPKQLAAEALHRVYCVAPCYRNEPHEKRRDGHLNVFHQIEVEIIDLDLQGICAFSLTFCADILERSRMPNVRELAPLFRDARQIDIATHAEREHICSTYDSWCSEISKKSEFVNCVLHTPQTPKPRLNKSIGNGLSEGFDILLPLGFGELASGGVRDKSELASFFGMGSERNSVESSGFGIGLERLVAFLLESHSLADILPEHHIWSFDCG